MLTAARDDPTVSEGLDVPVAEDSAVPLLSAPLSAEAIAEARQAAAARLAQEEIMLKAALAGTFDPEAHARLQENYRRDVQRINDDRDRKIAKIRSGSA